jgi:hypothetical protein
MDIYNLENIFSLSNEPVLQDDFASWIQQKDVMPFLEQEVEDEDIIIYTSLPHVFMHAVLIPQVELDSSAIEDLSRWDQNPYSGWSLVLSQENVWIEPPMHLSGSAIVSRGEQILFARTFHEVESKGTYFEVNQKISHILEIHYMSERNAWCKIDEHGDFQDVVKIIELKDLQRGQTGTVIAMNQKILGTFATAGGYELCRMFDFPRYKSGSFFGWKDEGKSIELAGDNIFGKLTVFDDYGSYSRGFQVRNISIPKEEIIDGTFGIEKDKQYTTFIAYDWKNKRIAEISCDPSALASYFVESELPYQTTPAFFKPEVLSKYKSDTAKYKLENRSISCRGTWMLQTFDTNEAGQVHTYLIYLSKLPYEEQLHWKQYNEEPKAPLSKRAFTTDFEGEFYDEYDPLYSLKEKLENLHREKVGWWKLRGENILERVNYPFTDSHDEWANEILYLDQLLVEGFVEKWLRKKALELGRTPDIRLRALKLAEECLVGLGFEADHAYQLLSPFHNVHNLRSVLKGHVAGNEASEMRKQAMREFGSFRRHFENLCAKCDESLEVLMSAFRNST